MCVGGCGEHDRGSSYVGIYVRVPIRVCLRLSYVSCFWLSGLTLTIPSVCVANTGLKLATKAGKREVLGNVALFKAKPPRSIVKVFLAWALRKSVWNVPAISGQVWGIVWQSVFC